MMPPAEYANEFPERKNFCRIIVILYSIHLDSGISLFLKVLIRSSDEI